MTLHTKAWLGFLFLALAMGLLLFLPAETLRYWQAWVYLGVFFGASLLITLYLMRNNPALLQRRLRGGPTAERRPTQQIIMSIASLGFIASLVVPALDHRRSWSSVPPWAAVAGAALVALSFLITFLVYRENPFTSATIELAEDQRVISTGPYAIVRHPMYAGGSLLFLGTPLALGSWWGLLTFPAVFPALIWAFIYLTHHAL